MLYRLPRLTGAESPPAHPLFLGAGQVGSLRAEKKLDYRVQSRATSSYRVDIAVTLALVLCEVSHSYWLNS